MTLDELLATDRAVLHAAEVASLLEVDERTVSRAVAAGLLPSVRVGRVLRIPVRKLIPLLTDVPTTEDEPGALTPGIATTQSATGGPTYDQHAAPTLRLAAVE
ncbi:helix-turn-helix domain-containing protein [Janibacter terrae]|uniref:helix-turn-helix domain-containing protein n=1 Tax=Janibacter terrae TaxID=103817 RepID=UPI0031F9F331